MDIKYIIIIFNDARNQPIQATLAWLKLNQFKIQNWFLFLHLSRSIHFEMNEKVIFQQ